MNTDFIKREAANLKLPPYWKLATIRCSLYAALVGWTAFLVGTEGYDSLSDMTVMQSIKLFGGIAAAMGGVWLAFLDQSLSRYNYTPPPNAGAVEPKQN